jgi:diguanylate cyclase (GGDEF)-like protein
VRSCGIADWCNGANRVWRAARWPQCLAVAFAPAMLAAAVQTDEPPGFRLDKLPQDLRGSWEIRLGEESPLATPVSAASTWRPIEVPGPWEKGPAPGYNGHAWYRTRLFVPKELTRKVLGISFPRIRDADALYLNGVRVGFTGGFPPHFEKATLYSRVYGLPGKVLRPDQWNTILVHVYNNAREGGIVRGPPKIGAYGDFVAAQHRGSYLILVFATLLVLVAANHFFLFVHRPETRSNLLFGLFSLSTATYMLTFSPTIGPMFLSLNTLFRINVILFPLSLLLLIAFLLAFFETRPPIPVRALIAALGLIAAVQAVWPRLAGLYVGVLATEYLAVPAAAVIVWLLARAVRRREPYAAAITAVLVLLVAAGLYDMAVDLNVAPTPSWNVAGMVFPMFFVPFYIVMGMVLGHQYAQYYTYSITDRLTGLMERHHFLERLAEEAERARRDGSFIVVGMLDLDSFKEINDNHTHLAGDVMLRRIADTVREQIRRFDLAGRFGGDEFCFGLVVRSPEEAVQMFERVREAVDRQQVSYRGADLRVTASIGAVACRPGGEEKPNELLEQADRALYRAKRAGGNRVLVAEFPHSIQERS